MSVNLYKKSTGQLTKFASNLYSDEKFDEYMSKTDLNTQSISEKQDKLTAGDNITIKDGIISATGGSGHSGPNYCESNTARDVNLKEASIENLEIVIGTEVCIKFTGGGSKNPSSGNLSLKVNDVTAEMSYVRNGSSVALGYSVANVFYNNKVHTFTYDGTYWVCTSYNYDGDTKNTAGASNSDAKLYLIGATAQDTNPKTYTHDTAYVGEDGCLYSNNKKVLVEGESGSNNIWVGTQEEWDALDKTDIPDGTEVHITDDAGDVTYKLIKTYDELMNNTGNNKLVDALVVKEVASHGGGASTWSEVAEKPFETIGQNLEVVDGVLNASGGTVPDDIVLLDDEDTPSVPTPRDADTLGGIAASEYIRKNDFHNYSTDEKVIGTWIDGKTLYETTIVSTNRPDGSEGCPVYDLSALHIDSIANMFGAMYLDVKANRPVIMPLPTYIQHSNQIGLDIDATNNVAITMTSTWIQYIDHWVLTIQYTKL